MDLQTLIDESEIRALAAGYSDAVRRNDIQGAAATYCEDGALMAFSGPEIVGRQAIGEALHRVVSPQAFVMQTCEGGLIEVEGDTARARWSVTEWINPKDSKELHVSLGVYEDTLIRTSEGWRFKRRRFHPLYNGLVADAGRARSAVMEHAFTRPWGASAD